MRSNNILESLKRAGVVDQNGAINPEALEVIKKLPVSVHPLNTETKLQTSSKKTKPQAPSISTVAIPAVLQSNSFLLKSLLWTNPKMGSKVSVLGNILVSFLDPRSVGRFASVLPIHFQPPLKNKHNYRIEWSVSAYNWMPRENVYSKGACWGDLFDDLYDIGKKITPDNMYSGVIRNCLKRTITAPFVSAMAAGVTVGSIILCAVVTPCVWVFDGEKEALSLGKGSLLCAYSMTKVTIGVPFLKTAAQTAACSIAYAGGTVANLCCNKIRNPSVRISIFNPPIRDFRINCD